MTWSLDWFAAEALARNAGAQIRRVAWTDRYLVADRGLLFIVDAGLQRVIKTTDYNSEDLNARDWTDQAFNANPCVAVPAYNTTPIVYRQWTDQPTFAAPPVPGFPSI
ncbi:MAG TPA: hypothetical protein VK961_01650 [Chthoniobacter sp.]|nr:hypothetical protein [Chthoniobacter sp.]